MLFGIIEKQGKKSKRANLSCMQKMWQGNAKFNKQNEVTF